MAGVEGTRRSGVEWQVLKALGVALRQMRDHSRQRTVAKNKKEIEKKIADQTSTNTTDTHTV